MRFKYISKGSFGKKKIYYSYISSHKHNHNFFVFLHGAYSTGLKDRYIDLSRQLAKKNIANSFSYETSRNLQSFEEKVLSMTFEDYTATFEGKTFIQEKEDIEIIFKYFMENFAKDSKAQVNLVGFSLGGTMASFLIKQYGKVLNSITLFGSGITTKGTNAPILSTYPSSQAILKNFLQFKGQLTLVQGTEDKVVPVQSARKIIFQANNAKVRKLILLNGVDHTFTKINDVNNEDKLNSTIYRIITSQDTITLE